MNAKQIKAIEVLAQGGQTYIEMADEIGCDVATLRRWRADHEFNQMVIERARNILKDALPDIYSALRREAIKGNFNHIKLVLEHLERLELDPLVRAQESVSFTWKAQEIV